MPINIAFLMIPGFQLLDMAGPLSVFQTAGEAVAGPQGPAYALHLVSVRGGRLASSAGVEVATRPWRDVHPDVVLVPGGEGPRQAGATPAACAFLHAAQARGARLASVCTGAFVLASAGLLEGRRATTHWRHAADLQRRYPGIKVDSDKIYLRDGQVWTSAGITAGIDLALAMVEEDLGAQVAHQAARDMVVYHRRAGGQSQFSALQDLAPRSERMRRVLGYIGQHLTAPLSIEELATAACLSPRQFMRSFKSETGQTPAKAVERIRAEAARTHVEAGNMTIDAVARVTGFADAERMRRAFVRRYGQPPQALRRAARDALLA
ncbi:GlxA family transcriptional regulator [Bordetella sp. BOR01]|uniref:GlxA family transcriptional regulator n=1 Tax=Bordetella sp. BOR01 TaxID=2854779 RepID=UPI001C44BB5D|nr:GlxA family transcriptional regulator [Bordetella sp. BOR01]MBV7486804.1 GlxA family transcriptional regulator [Bordetella sp. BOR01]